MRQTALTTIGIWVVVFMVAGFLIGSFLKDGETTKFDSLVTRPV